MGTDSVDGRLTDKVLSLVSGRGVASGLLGFGGAFVVVVLGGKVLFPTLASTTGVPNGKYLEWAIVGGLISLLAIGLVLIYRANRIINFAQGTLGAVAATLAAQLFQVYQVPFIFSVIAGLGSALLLSLLTEFFVIRRFSEAPRLILTVATIGVAQILGIIELLPNTLNEDADRATFRAFKSPLSNLDFTFGNVRFTGDHMLALVAVPAILVGLALFFRFTRYGIAARAMAENADRARLLGCRIKRVSLVVWGLAGLLSGLAAILRAPILGFQLGAISGPSLLLAALAAAVIGRMQSLPVTVGAAMLLTMGQQTIFFAFGRTGPATGFLLGVIVLTLIVQRKRLGRVDPGTSSWQAVEEVRPIPRELRGLPEVRGLQYGVFAVLAVLFGVFYFVFSPSVLNLISVIFVYAMVGVSLVMLTGWSGHLSLGQWAIVGVGALVAGKLATQDTPMDFFLILLIAGVIGAAVSLVIGLPALRIRGLFLGVTTLAFALAGFDWFFQWEILTLDGAVRRPVIFGLWDSTAERNFYLITLIGLAFAMWMAKNVRRSRLGRNLIGIRDNEAHAQAFGVRVTANKLTVFAISGFIAAFAGGLYTYTQQALGHQFFPAQTSLVMFSMVVIGGMGSLTGALLGATYVRGVQFFLPAEFQLLATGFGLLILLMIFPGGLGQIFYAGRDRFLRRVADRRGIVVPSLVADVRREEAVVPTGPGAPSAEEEEEEEAEPAEAGVRS